jgi:hypothetical protein
MFADANGVGFADMRVDGHRETWPIRSKAFRSAYIRYLKRQLEELVNTGSSMAGWLSVSIKKHRVNEAIDDFEMQAISSAVREYVRCADGGDIYVDLGDGGLLRVTARAGDRIRRSGFAAAPGCCHCRFRARTHRSFRSSTLPTAICARGRVLLALCAPAVLIRCLR